MSAAIKKAVRRSVLNDLCIALAHSRSFQERPSTKPLRKQEEQYRQEALLALIKAGEDAWRIDLTQEKERMVE